MLKVESLLNYGTRGEPVAPGTYLLKDGTKTIGKVYAFSDDALIEVHNKGRVISGLNEILVRALLSGEISEEDIDKVILGATPSCFCDICPPKKSGDCAYKKSAE